MAQPGILPAVPALRPLRRVSPSRFLSLRECALREIWTASKQAPLLPASPAARLGSVIHRLLQEAGEGLLGDGNRTAVDSEWLKLVEIAEGEMRDSWLERSLVPLSKTVPQYEVRKIRACIKAAEVAKESIRQPQSSGTIAANRFESWVETPDGLVGGSIDQVKETSGGAILRDFKSGHVIDIENQAAGPEIKEEYKLQLKLYAALFASKHGRWPVKLEVVPLQGPAREVPFDARECNQLLQEAVTSLKQLNERIDLASRQLAAGTAIRAFANPSPSNCRFCVFRPCCEAFRAAKDVTACDAGWARDVWGVVSDYKILGNQKIGLSLRVSGYPYEVARIRGIDPNPERHPALPCISVGEKVAVYNLRGSAERGEFSETSSTTIYLVPAGVNPSVNA